MLSILRAVAALFLALALWAVVQVPLVAVGLAFESTQLLDPWIKKRAEQLASALSGLADGMSSLSHGGVIDPIQAVVAHAALMVAQHPALAIPIATVPSVFWLVQLAVIRRAAAFLTGGPPPFLKPMRKIGRAPLAPHLEALHTFADPLLPSQGIDNVSFYGVFGPDQRANCEQGKAWLQEIKTRSRSDRPWHVGQRDADASFPTGWRPARNTAIFIDLYEKEAHELTTTFAQIREIAKNNDTGRQVRILLSWKRDVAHALARADRPEDVSKYLHRPSQKKGIDSGRPSANDIKKNDERGKRVTAEVRATDVQPPYLFGCHAVATLADDQFLADWAQDVVECAEYILGPHYYRYLAAALLSDGRSWMDWARQSTGADMTAFWVQFFRVQQQDDATEGTDGDETQDEATTQNWARESRQNEDGRGGLFGAPYDFAVAAALVKRAGVEAVRETVDAMLEESPDRVVLGANQLVMSEHIAWRVDESRVRTLFPDCVLTGLAETSTADVACRAFIDPIMKVVVPEAAWEWTARIEAASSMIVGLLPKARRPDLLRLLAGWQGDYGSRVELELLAASSAWIQNPAALAAVLSDIFSHHEKALQDISDLELDLPSPPKHPFSAIPSVPPELQRILWIFDRLDDAFRAVNIGEALDVSEWSAVEGRLLKSLTADDEFERIAAAWALFWYAAGHDAVAPIAPFSEEAVDVLAVVVADPTTSEPVWWRCAETLGKICAPEFPTDPVYQWALFADGVKTADRIRSIEPVILLRRVHSAVQEARRRLASSVTNVRLRCSASLLIILYAPGDRAAVNGLVEGLSQPGVRLTRHELLMIRLVASGGPEVCAALTKLMRKGSDFNADRSFLALCGLRARTDIEVAVQPLREPRRKWYADVLENWPPDTPPALGSKDDQATMPID